MDGLNFHQQIFLRRLARKGMGKSSIPNFFWTLKSCLLADPKLNRFEAAKRLQGLGWNDFELDDQTFRLARQCFKIGEATGL